MYPTGYMRILVPEVGNSGRDKWLHSTDSVGWNYLSLPEIPTSGTQVLRSSILLVNWVIIGSGHNGLLSIQHRAILNSWQTMQKIHCEEEFSIDFLPFFLSLHITQFLPNIFPLNWFCSEIFFFLILSTTVLSYSIGIVSTLLIP